jgi:hypothetical protein
MVRIINDFFLTRFRYSCFNMRNVLFMVKIFGWKTEDRRLMVQFLCLIVSLNVILNQLGSLLVFILPFGEVRRGCYSILEQL